MKRRILLSFLLCLTAVCLLSFTADEEYQRGDVNHDGNVSVADVSSLIDYLMYGTWNDDPVNPELQDETITVNGVSFKMVAVEGGTFMMGAADDDPEAYDVEKPAHQVTLSSYYIGETEVTQALWVAVMGSNPSTYRFDLRRPVETISWDDCQEFIAKLNELTGKQFRLPTEAEWEFAARGGNKSLGYIYAGSDTLEDVAWCIYNSNDEVPTHVVATLAPNELGIYDMCGNVYEFCQDIYGPYSSEAQIDPIGAISGDNRVVRGGYWGDIDTRNYCLSMRGGGPQDYAHESSGLRLAL